MISKSKREQANKQLKQVFDSYRAEYEALAEKSRQEYMRNLKPGELIPKQGKLYGSEAKEKFRNLCSEYRGQAQAVLDDLISESKRAATEAPSAEAVNAITLFNLRKDITEADALDMINRYGDNPLAYEAIRSTARAHDINTIGAHPVTEQAENLAHLSGRINQHLTLESAETGHTSPGFLAAVSQDIDNAVPTE